MAEAETAAEELRALNSDLKSKVAVLETAAGHTELWRRAEVTACPSFIRLRCMRD